MSAYTTKELKAILKLHQKWLNNEVGGTRANLTKQKNFDDETIKNTANKTLESAGFTDVTITGWNPLACGEDDTYATGFTAINPQGKVVEGTVCSGVFKGATIRF